MELPKISENLQKRIISAGILIPIVLIIVAMGGWIYYATVSVMSIIMSFEWFGIIKTKTDAPKDEKTLKKWEYGGIIYISLFASSLIYLREDENGFGLIMFLALTVWATDIAAYFAGRSIGGPKICPKISPNKTWAGLGGGILAASFIGAFSSIFTPVVGVFWLILLGAVMAVISQAGDFFESWVKRQFGVKDSGNIIPGHGGVMDRVDGVASAAPVLMIISMLFGA